MVLILSEWLNICSEKQELFITLRHKYGSSEFKEREDVVCNSMFRHHILHNLLKNTELPQRWEEEMRTRFEATQGRETTTQPLFWCQENLKSSQLC